MTLKRLRDRTLHWQKLLNLPEWSITVRRPKKGEGRGCVGLCYHWPEELIAEIVVKNGAGEDTLIHELLHLVHDGHVTNRPYDELHERALNRVTAALIDLSKPNEAETT